MLAQMRQGWSRGLESAIVRSYSTRCTMALGDGSMKN